MIILDTNVLSELMRPQPHAHVVDWVTSTARSELVVTSITEAEILYGIDILPDGDRRRRLAAAAMEMFAADFAGKIVGFDAAAAPHFAVVVGSRRRAGRPIDAMDAMICAIARSAGAVIATRDIAGFADCGVPLIDPWTA
jgi:predicted nucleic acid-binding protein